MAEVADPLCDPKNPKKITFEDVQKASELLDKSLKRYVQRTMCYESTCHHLYNMTLYFKMENMQRSGSFKSRGILCALLRLPEDIRKKGVVIASWGNEALGLCYYTNEHGIPAIVVMPVDASLWATERLKSLGAKVVIHGRILKEADSHAYALAKKYKLTYINSRDNPDVLAGYGTIAQEILEDVPDVDAIIVPVGSGGLAAAVAKVVKHEKNLCLVYGVQPENTKAFFEAAKAFNQAVSFDCKQTLAESLSVTKAGVNGYSNAILYLDKLLLVKEEWIAQAMQRITETERFVVEGAAACPLAAIIGNLVPELKNKIVVCIISGGNVDCYLYTRSFQFGKASEGHLLKFTVDIYDSGSAQTDLFRLLEKKHYDIRYQATNRYWTADNVSKIRFTLVCHADSLEHTLKLRRLLNKTYPLCCEFENEPFVDSRCCECFAFSHKAYIRKPPVLGETPIDNSVLLSKTRAKRCYDGTCATFNAFCA